MQWNSALYDKKHDFVAEYGKELLEFVPKNEEQKILDLGCGTGTLTVQLLDYGNVIGIDSSYDMISKAKSRFETIDFMVCDALTLPFEKEFDVVFSNAVFHWIADHDTLLQNIHKCLKPGGLLVCEFGANGNIATIERAFAEAYRSFGYIYHSKFNFPATEIFRGLLERNGFIIDQICDYDRPTILKDGEAGLINWMTQFFASDLSVIPESEQIEIFEEVKNIAKDTLWNGREWIADYRRLRVVAHT